MPNLLRLVLELTTEPETRAQFRADPDAAVDALDVTSLGLTGEDVDAVLALVRRHVGGSVEHRLSGSSPSGTGPGEQPRAAVIRHLLAACAALDEPAAASPEQPDDGLPSAAQPGDEPHVIRELGVGNPDEPADDGSTTVGGGAPLLDGPPGPRPHLWAVAPDAPDDDGGERRRVDPSHPAAGASPSLSAVPEPDEGFRFDPLELVVLTDGWPQADIEPGALATVVAVHDDPEAGLRYEIEVADAEGGRRFLGLVPERAVDRPL